MFDKLKLCMYKTALSGARGFRKSEINQALGAQKEIVKKLILGVDDEKAIRYSPQT